MPDSVARIGDLSPVSGGGGGSGRKRGTASRRHYHGEEEHDTVSISDEAKRRALTDEFEEEAAGE